ncbi:MAG: helix-hairpin-helix domain-containing protein [Cyclobacteriaceae bacterium]
MNSNLKSLSILALLAIVAACQPEKKSEEAAVKEEKKEEETSSILSDGGSIINPNLASEEVLTTTGMPATLISSVIENRPFLSMTDFDALVTGQLDSVAKAALYVNVFVPLNLNTTAEADFKLVPGVGDRMAHEFEEYRPYVKIDQFRKEIGKYVDEAEVTRYEKYVFVPVELNTATKEEILAIPGVGERMLHEFEEYRPYQNMEQFRKEIGKYVDEKELARLERFVYLKDQ